MAGAEAMFIKQKHWPYVDIELGWEGGILERLGTTPGLRSPPLKWSLV